MGMAAKEKSLILNKEVALDVGDDSKIFTFDVGLEELEFWSVCPEIKAICEHFSHPDRSIIRKAINENRHTLLLFCEVFDNGQLCFDVDKGLIKYLWEMLPEPFLEIRIVHEDSSKPLILEKRLPIQDMISNENEKESNRGLREIRIPFKNELPDEKRLRCRIMFGWKEPAKKVQMCTKSLMENLFEDESSKDLTVIAGNGNEVKCHSFIFSAAQARAFSAMLSTKTGMKEAKSKRVEMRENSEEGIRHLLMYLYGLELTISDMACDVALELFQTAHKYGLGQLEGSLLKLFLGEDKEWFTPEVVLEMYFNVRNLDVFEKLREHALFLMASMTTEELRACEVFEKLDRIEQVEVLLKLVDYMKKPDFHNRVH